MTATARTPIRILPNAHGATMRAAHNSAPLDDAKTSVRNLVTWLGRRPQ